MISVCCYTDGACKGNPGVGGWGYLYSIGEIVVNEPNVINVNYGGSKKTTNSEMEIVAVYELLTELNDNNLLRDTNIIIHIDNEYVVNTLVKKSGDVVIGGKATGWIAGWKVKNYKKKAHVEWWKKIDALVQKTQSLKIVWVKAHQNNESIHARYNNLADSLANKGVKF